MNVTFSGKTVIVTGAAHGFGRAISRAFAERGAQVWACDVIDDELRETERLCRATGGVCYSVELERGRRACIPPAAPVNLPSII